MIGVDRDLEFAPAVKKIMDKLDEILRYQKNFDSEIFDSLSRQEEKIDLVKSNLELIIKISNKKVK